MILTESRLRELTAGATIQNEARIQQRYFLEGNGKLSLFLSHKHNDLEYLERVRQVLKRFSVVLMWNQHRM